MFGDDIDKEGLIKRALGNKLHNVLLFILSFKQIEVWKMKILISVMWYAKVSARYDK